VPSQTCLSEGRGNQKTKSAMRFWFCSFNTFGQDSRSSAGTSNSRRCGFRFSGTCWGKEYWRCFSIFTPFGQDSRSSEGRVNLHPGYFNLLIKARLQIGGRQTRRRSPGRVRFLSAVSRKTLLLGRV
jgi:hypothetical protein